MSEVDSVGYRPSDQVAHENHCLDAGIKFMSLILADFMQRLYRKCEYELDTFDATGVHSPERYQLDETECIGTNSS